MTRRTRSMLVDASIGKIFTNTNQITPTDPSKLIAGTRLQSASIASSKSATARVVNNLSGKVDGLKFISGSVIASIIISAAKPPEGLSILFTFKVGTSYETSTVIATDNLPSMNIRKTVLTGWTIPAGSSIFVDITQVGSIKTGNGVGIQFNYYAG